MMAGSPMNVEVLASKVQGFQQPHTQDWLYFIPNCTGEVVINEQRFDAMKGDAVLWLLA